MGSIFRKQDLINAFGGGQGGLIAMWITMPVETVQKMQATAKPGQSFSVWYCVKTTWQRGGLVAFWRGIGILSVQGFVEKFCYFLPYSIFVYFYERRVATMGPTMNLVIGYLAELARIPFNYPLEVVATYTQTNPDAKNLRDSIARIYAGKAGGDGRGGIGAFWRGISAYFLVAARPALSIAFFDQAKRVYLRSTSRPITALLTFGEAFALGAVGRFFATVICYPCFKQKVLAQSGKGSVLQEWREQGLAKGVYKGFWSEVARGVLFNAILMATKESVENFNIRLFGLAVL